MSKTQNNKELVRVGHEFAKAMSADTPIIEIAKMMSRLAERLDCTTAALHATQAQRDQLASKNAALKLANIVPEGYALVPQEMCLSAEAMEALCFHCGDGGNIFGEFTDGVLFVGESEPEEGKKIHGLHIVTADYPEEGCTIVCEFMSVIHDEVRA